MVDGYAAMVREHPAIRRLWLSGTLDAATRRLERETDATIATRLGALLREQAGTRRGTPEQWRTLVALIDGLLRHAFTEDPDGDPRRAARGAPGGAGVRRRRARAGAAPVAPQARQVTQTYGRCLQAVGDGVARRNFSKASGREVITPSTHQEIRLRHVAGVSGSVSPNQFCQA